MKGRLALTLSFIDPLDNCPPIQRPEHLWRCTWAGLTQSESCPSQAIDPDDTVHSLWPWHVSSSSCVHSTIEAKQQKGSACKYVQRRFNKNKLNRITFCETSGSTSSNWLAYQSRYLTTTLDGLNFSIWGHLKLHSLLSDNGTLWHCEKS